jgi:probable rRNA maturation factor
MIHIQIDDEFWSEVKSTGLRRSARMACSLCGLPRESDFTIVITGDEQVRSLNSEFRHLDESTDVLSFPANENDPETGKGYLGDIIISFTRAARQANAAGHPTANELRLLVIHGILHLAGYDHTDADEERVMFNLQNEALNRLNISIKGFNT